MILRSSSDVTRVTVYIWTFHVGIARPTVMTRRSGYFATVISSIPLFGETVEFEFVRAVQARDPGPRAGVLDVAQEDGFGEKRVEFHGHAGAAVLLAGYERRAGAGERVEHEVPGLRRVTEGVPDEFDRFLGVVAHSNERVECRNSGNGKIPDVSLFQYGFYASNLSQCEFYVLRRLFRPCKFGRFFM